MIPKTLPAPSLRSGRPLALGLRSMLSFLSLIGLLVSACGAQAQPGTPAADIYSFQVPGLLGDTIDFSEFKGKKILIVNTASECGYTPQYEGLEKLHQQFQDQLVIVGFPSNDFGGQEPGTAQEIAAFCEKNYGVSFLMAAKVKIKGKAAAPIYSWLREQGEALSCPSTVRWNFHKFLLDEEGQLIACYPSKTEPLSPEILDALKR